MGDDFAIFLSCLDAEEILLYCGAKRKIGVFADGTRTEEDLYRGYDLSIWNFLDDIWNRRAAGRSGHSGPVSGQKWTRSYIRQQGISWLLLGIPWLILWLTLDSSVLDFRLKALLLIAVSLPAFFYTIWMDKAYRKRLKEKS